MHTTLVNPPELGTPVGYSHGVVARGHLLALAGQIGSDREGHLVSSEIVPQFDQAFANLARVLEAAGGRPEHLVSLRIYVTNKQRYIDERRAIGEAYRRHFGHHYPAMALLQVAGLLVDHALVEVEGLAVLPDDTPPAAAPSAHFPTP